MGLGDLEDSSLDIRNPGCRPGTGDAVLMGPASQDRHRLRAPAQTPRNVLHGEGLTERDTPISHDQEKQVSLISKSLENPMTQLLPAKHSKSQPQPRGRVGLALWSWSSWPPSCPGGTGPTACPLPALGGPAHGGFLASAQLCLKSPLSNES